MTVTIDSEEIKALVTQWGAGYFNIEILYPMI